MPKISAFYLDKQKSFIPKKKLLLETLRCKISVFLNSNTCFCSQLYGRYSLLILGQGGQNKLNLIYGSPVIEPAAKGYFWLEGFEINLLSPRILICKSFRTP